MEQQQHNDEIDLLELFNSLLKSIYYFINHWYKTMAVVTLIGIIIGFGLYLKDSDEYTNKMIAQARFIDKALIVELINSLNSIIGDEKIITETLNIPFEGLRNISSIQADTIENMKNLITVKLIYSDTIDANVLLNGLVYYINNNEYIKREMKISKRISETLINKTENEISKLDSLQKSILKNTSNSKGNTKGSLLVMNEQITNFFHDDILKLEQTKQNYLSSLERMTAFDVISQFEQAKIKERSMIKTITTSGFIAFILGFFVLIGIEIRRKAIQLIKK